VNEPLPEGVFHLLTADDDLVRPDGNHVTVCGALVRALSLPPSCYAPGSKPNRDPLYCPTCVSTAVRWNSETKPARDRRRLDDVTR
jgi:hypothetical protein